MPICRVSYQIYIIVWESSENPTVQLDQDAACRMREMVNLESLKDGFGGDEIALLIRLEPGLWRLQLATKEDY